MGSCDLQCVNAKTDCWCVAVNTFKQALHLFVAAAQNHNVIGIGEVGHINVGSKPNPLDNLLELDQESSR